MERNLLKINLAGTEFEVTTIKKNKNISLFMALIPLWYIKHVYIMFDYMIRVYFFIVVVG